MSTKMKLLPALITLIAGAFTSVVTYILHYDTGKSLWILLIVLLVFYILGTVLQKVVYKFELQNEMEEAKRLEEEGKVVEKDAVAGEGEQTGDATEEADGEVYPEEQPYEEQESMEEEGSDDGAY
ncbi:MAG: hypothetical protein K6E68_09120 [Lachnospiraceae bacterium]|nr:hypothetical protein [Lachnospiraceae bacterium]